MTDTRQAEAERVAATLDPDDLRVLDAVARRGAETTASDIADQTGLDPSEVRYRAKRLSAGGNAERDWDGEGLVELSGSDGDGDGRRPERVSLTESGAEFVDLIDTDAYLSDYAEAELEALRATVSRIERTVNAMDETGGERDDGARPAARTVESELRQLTNRVARLEERVESVDETVSAVRRYLQSKNVNLSQYREGEQEGEGESDLYE